MGISLNPLHFLAHTRGPLGRTLTLGHQDNNLPRDRALIQRIFQEAGREVDVDAFLHEKYADAILLALGATEVVWRFCKGFGFSVNRIDQYVRGSYPQANPIPDPEEAGQRITINTPPQYIDLMTDAVKRENLYPEYLYQSDYVAHWSAKG